MNLGAVCSFGRQTRKTCERMGKWSLKEKEPKKCLLMSRWPPCIAGELNQICLRTITLKHKKTGVLIRQLSSLTNLIHYRWLLGALTPWHFRLSLIKKHGTRGGKSPKLRVTSKVTQGTKDEHSHHLPLYPKHPHSSCKGLSLVNHCISTLTM